MIKRLVFLTLVFSLTLGVAQGREAFRFTRYPALSPDGKTLAFSYQGDIWTVSSEGGRAWRLTLHQTYDWNPVFSPDGKYIAFNTLRHGSADIYVMKRDGTEIRRLTYYSGTDRLQGWTPDGKSLLFTSRRSITHLGSLVYKIPLAGGTPTVYLKVRARRVALSRDFQKAALVIGRNYKWYRKGYRGSGNLDIYIENLKTKKIQKVTDFKGRDDFPMWSEGDKSLYFVSNRSGVNNLWVFEEGAEKPVQLTNFKEDGIRFPSLAPRAKKIAFAAGLDLYIYHLEKKKVKQIKVWGPRDRRLNPTLRKTYTSGAQSWALSPNGKVLAFVVHGEIFVLDSQKGGKARRITESAYRMRDLAWSPDGKQLYYASNETGAFELYSIRPLDDDNFLRAFKFKSRAITKGKTHATEPVLSPDGKKIAFTQGRSNLAVLNLKSKKWKILDKSSYTLQYQWSPDSRWLVYARSDNEFNTDIWIASLKGKKKKLKKPFNISRHPDYDYSPQWSPNGRYIAFVSKRNNNDLDVWIAYLRKEDGERTREEWDDFFSGQGKKRAQKKKKKKKIKKEKGSKKKKKKIKIDFEDLPSRLRQLTRYVGDEKMVVFSPDSKKIYFKTNIDKKQDFYSVRIDGRHLKRLTNRNYRPTSGDFSPGKKLYFKNSRGHFYRLNPRSGSARPIPFRAAITIDRQRQREVVFLEAWATLNQYFYDPKFHGVDWKKMYNKYKVWIRHASHKEDYYSAIRIMLGELNASHLGIYGRRSRPEEPTGRLGINFILGQKGLVVTRVIDGTPADRTDSRLKKGDRILALGTDEIKKGVNVNQLLAGTVGEEILIKVKRGKKTLEFPLRPTSRRGIRSALYREWVKENRRQVEKASDGALGYLHIQGMGWRNVEKFERELYSAAHGKKGILIDVRYNGGGWTTDYLLTILMVRRHAFTIPRDGGKGYPQGRLPYYAWTKPAATLCNEYSFSNAEIFSHAFKSLNRGPVIGQTTFGGVISTGGTRLMDGSRLRLPFRGWYVAGSGLNMENNGCVPHRKVVNPPGSEISGKDRQLQVAVEVLLETLKKKKSGEKK